VCFVHYADLLVDLEGEMRRLARFLGIDVPDDSWPAVVDRCSLDEMRSAAAATGGLVERFEGGAESFFNKGTNGLWVDVLSDEQLGRYRRHVSEGLDSQTADWLEHGSLALGRRP
jgi:aryl sulfotransferase